MATGDDPDQEWHDIRGLRSRRVGVRLWLAVFVAVLVVVAGAVLLVSHPAPRTPKVTASASQVLLNVSDIPQIGWGEWASGTNGTGAWRLFAVHNELILAILNVTLWVMPTSEGARQAMDAIAHDLPYATEDSGVPGADGSVYWEFNFGQYAGMVVRRYNVVFLLSAHLESSFSLTDSDLARWSGWQLLKVDRFAA